MNSYETLFHKALAPMGFSYSNGVKPVQLHQLKKFLRNRIPVCFYVNPFSPAIGYFFPIDIDQLGNLNAPDDPVWLLESVSTDPAKNKFVLLVGIG